jgi:predicted enzyme related to lactoylglutathione lyase
MPEITSYAQGTPSWAELDTTDEAGALAFYGPLFGWADDPQEMGPNWYYHMQRLNGLEAAAIYQQSEEERGMGIPPHWNVYLTVENADEVAEKVGQNGGNVLFGPMDVFEAGRMAMLQDRQGAAFAIWQPNQHIGARVKFDPGAITWNELLTTDKEDALSFYQTVLGIERGETMPPMDYTLVRAGGTEVAGVMQMTPEMGEFPPHWSVYFAVADVDATVSQAQSLGGTIIASAFDIPDIGRIAVLMDPQGAAFSIFQGAEAA